MKRVGEGTQASERGRTLLVADRIRLASTIVEGRQVWSGWAAEPPRMMHQIRRTVRAQKRRAQGRARMGRSVEFRRRHCRI